MKRCEVLEILKVSRHTLKKYVNEGKIKATLLQTGLYDYDRDSVFAFANLNNHRKNAIYCRVYDYDNQQERLNKQVDNIQSWCINKEIIINKIYTDICSSIDFKRNGLDELIDDIVDNKIETVYIWSRGVFSSFFFDALEKLFAKFRTRIICVNPQFIDTEIYKESKDLLQFIKEKISEKKFKKIQEIAEN